MLSFWSAMVKRRFSFATKVARNASGSWSSEFSSATIRRRASRGPIVQGEPPQASGLPEVPWKKPTGTTSPRSGLPASLRKRSIGMRTPTFREACHHCAAKNIGQSSQGVPRGSRRARGRRNSQGTDVASGWRDRAACRSLAHAVYFSSRLVVQAPCCESGSWRMSRLCHDRTGRHHGNLPQGAGTFPERINSNHVWSQRRTPPRQAWLHQAIIAGRICKNESERAMKRNVDIDIANPDETIPQAALSGCALVPGAKAC